MSRVSLACLHERLVTDGGIFKAKQSGTVYSALGIEKEQIERRRPYQSCIETTFGIQKRMADWHFAKAEIFADLARAHDAWRGDYNAQRHWAHEGKEDGRRSPQGILGFYTALLRHREGDLHSAFFSTRHARVLDALGYVRFWDWKLYGEEHAASRTVRHATKSNTLRQRMPSMLSGRRKPSIRRNTSSGPKGSRIPQRLHGLRRISSTLP